MMGHDPELDNLLTCERCFLAVHKDAAIHDSPWTVFCSEECEEDYYAEEEEEE